MVKISFSRRVSALHEDVTFDFLSNYLREILYDSPVTSDLIDSANKHLTVKPEAIART